MDWREFGASVVQSILSWPVALLIIVIILRKSLSQVLSGISSGMNEFSIKAFGQELKVTRQIEELKDKAELAEVTATPNPATAPVEPTTEPASKVPEEASTLSRKELLDYIVARRVGINPNEAILDLWAALQDELGDLAIAAGLDINSWGRPSVVSIVIDRLKIDGILSPATADQLRGMMQVRTGISHGQGKATTEAAADFYPLAVRMWDTLRAARKRIEGP